MTSPVLEVEARPCTLYRHFAADGSLLYVGITFDPKARRGQHAGDKPWWMDVASTKYQHFPTRDAAMAAERDAIRAEHPRYNVMHNDAVAAALPPAMRSPGERIWRLVSHGGFARETPLWLTWEIEGCRVSQDYLPDEISADELFYLWMRRYWPRGGWAPIYWRIMPVTERAPFQFALLREMIDHLPERTNKSHAEYAMGMLRAYEWPVDVETGERLNFMSLPVPDMSWSDPTKEFGPASFIQESTGWKPGALQSHVNVDMLMGDEPGNYLAVRDDSVPFSLYMRGMGHIASHARRSA